MKGHDFSASLREGKYTSIGCYPKFAMIGESILCIDCCKKNHAAIRLALMTKAKRDENYCHGIGANWEDPDLYCDECNQRIESAYAEDQAEPSRDTPEEP